MKFTELLIRKKATDRARDPLCRHAAIPQDPGAQGQAAGPRWPARSSRRRAPTGRSPSWCATACLGRRWAGTSIRRTRTTRLRTRPPAPPTPAKPRSTGRGPCPGRGEQQHEPDQGRAPRRSGRAFREPAPGLELVRHRRTGGLVDWHDTEAAPVWCRQLVQSLESRSLQSACLRSAVLAKPSSGDRTGSARRPPVRRTWTCRSRAPRPGCGWYFKGVNVQSGEPAR